MILILGCCKSCPREFSASTDQFLMKLNGNFQFQDKMQVNISLACLVFPPAPKKGMVEFPGKGHFKHVTTV